MIKTWGDIPKATNKELIDFLKSNLRVVLKKADLHRRIIVIAFNDIIKEIESRMVIHA